MHLGHISIKISKNAGILSHLENEMPSNILLHIYNSVMLLYFIYCCTILGFTYQIHITNVFTIQKKALQIISYSPKYCHTVPILNNLGIHNIHQLIQYHTLIFMLQHQNKMLTNVFEKKFIKTNRFHTYENWNAQSLRSKYF